jgi:hypothetical protein
MFPFSVSSRANAVVIQLLTKPTDFEQSDSLKLLLHGNSCPLDRKRIG